MLRDFAASGQSIRTFCRHRQLSEPSFYAWRRIVARRDATTPRGSPVESAAPAAPVFLPIHLSKGDVVPIEIVLGEGCCIRLRPPVDREALSEVVAALRSAGAGEA